MTQWQKAHITGVTIFETLLVLVIIGGILFFSISQYMSFRRDSDVQVVRRNVDTLFDAMVKYYRANCNARNNPLSTFNPKPIVTLDLKGDLIKQGYLDIPNNTLPLSPIVDGTKDDQGYLLQFNQIQDPNTLLPERTFQAPPGTFLGYIVGWQIQISVKLNRNLDVNLYGKLLGADCLTQMSGAGGALCTGTNSKNPEVAVFMRAPSFASSQESISGNSTYWVSNPTVRQFSQMYSTFPILNLTNGNLTRSQFYTCGGG